MIGYGIIQEYNRKFKKEKKSGIQETFYIFTDEGIYTVIGKGDDNDIKIPIICDNENLSIENFWKLVLFYFNKENKIKTTLSFESVLSKYIEVLGIDKKLILYDLTDDWDTPFLVWYNEVGDSSPEDCKNFLENHKKLFSKIKWNSLSKDFDKNRLCSCLTNAIEGFIGQYETETYAGEYQLIRILNDLKSLEKRHHEKYYKLYNIGKEIDENINIKQIKHGLNKEFFIINEIENYEFNSDINNIEENYADYVSFLFYVELIISFQNYEWSKFFERTNLTEWFELWKNKILDYRRESVKEIESILTI
ncbi:hypothetical protein [Nitrosopumilus sp. b3]|uniref:hypothetical protein n=1 Tax=Nitrosopumilus sp. b3 TaxID=2109909 RepID=UPI0015F76D74|nr:hypothetical protein [Nitrosopumilus sp. b3]